MVLGSWAEPRLGKGCYAWNGEYWGGSQSAHLAKPDSQPVAELLSPLPGIK